MTQQTHNGFYIIESPVSKFEIRMHDKMKNAVEESTAFNLGFFANYSEGGIKFTMPVANLVADQCGNLNRYSRYYLGEWSNGQALAGNKVYLNVNQNAGKQFANKQVSTLIIAKNNKVAVRELDAIPFNVKYAVSGVPIIRNGQDVSWKNFACKQGWDGSVMYATYRNWIGIKNNMIYVISGKTSTSNYLATSEFYEKIKDIGLTDCIAVDGGGSYFLKVNGQFVAKYGERQINNIGVILP